MSKHEPPVRPPRSRTTRPPAEREAAAEQREHHPAIRPVTDHRPLLARILDTPGVERMIPRLQPDVLHRIIERSGLEDSGELVALATPAQLGGVLDLDLWRSARPGRDEHLDVARFGTWLEILLESGGDTAARTLAGLDSALVSTALAKHIRVFDIGAVSGSSDTDDELETESRPGADLSATIGGYRITARRDDAWDAIVSILIALDARHGKAFHRVMRASRRLSDSDPEIDGLDNLLGIPEQAMFDLAAGRDRRRQRQGFATPADARAFLDQARKASTEKDDSPERHVVANAYFHAMDEDDDEPDHSADAGADTEVGAATDEGEPGPDASQPSEAEPGDAQPDSSAALVDILIDAGVLSPAPRALLEAPQGQTPRLVRIQAHLRFAYEHDAAAYATRSQELAFLANTILAGCSIQARPFTLQEASDAAVSVCNLGLENASQAAPLPDDFLIGHDLIGAFQVGWRILHHDVCMFAAEQLIATLRRLKIDDRDIQAGLRALRIELTKHTAAGTPWRARDAMDVLTSLDMPAWAALLALIDECPAIHAGLRASQDAGTRVVRPEAFEFISENSQIAMVRDFLAALPDTLRG